MSKLVRKAIARHVPAHFHDPVGLAMRLIRSRDPAARFALLSAALGLLLTPLDLLLRPSESHRCRRAAKPERPIIFVCGPPRSGTSLVAQVLVKNLPVAYMTNLTSLFPRSPLTASALFGRLIGGPGIDYRSYYGKTAGLGGVNDGLYLWDRWFGADRKALPQGMSPVQEEDMRRFFGACESLFQRPLVNKNNSLSTCAHLVAEALDTASFICITRDARYLAQSLLKARHEMYGDPRMPYGVDDPRRPYRNDADPIEDVCSQVIFHERAIEEEERRVGPERFWVVSYEHFCRDPGNLVEQVATRILRQPPARGSLEGTLKPFEVSRKLTAGADAFSSIEKTLERLRQSCSALGAADAR